MLPAEPFRPRPADWLQAAAVAVALFALYAATAPRTVALEDDGLCFRAESEQSLSADAAGRPRLRHPAVAGTGGVAQPLRHPLLAGNSRPAALCVDGAPLVDGVADQLRRPAGEHSGDHLLRQPGGLRRR